MATVEIKSVEAPAGPAPAPAGRTGAQAIVDTLRAANVEYVFGYSGGGTMHVISAISRSNMPNLSARTELGSAWMSYGYNRIKRRVASACLFHCVGSLHVAPVIYAAKLDSTPFLMIDVNLDQSLDMREGLQEALEVYPALKPLTKYIRKVTSVEDLPLAIRQGILSASTGRFGPAVLDLGYQVINAQTTCPIEELELPEPPAASGGAIEKAMAMLHQAKRPVIIAGAGVHLSDATRQLAAFAEAAGIPVVSTSWGGRGVISDDHPLFAGVMGAFGWVSANDIVQRADLWIALGTTFSQMSTGAWSIDRPAKTIQVDIDPGQLGKIFQPTLGVVADAGQVLEQLTTALTAGGHVPESTEASEWILHMQEERATWLTYLATMGATSDTPINQYHLIQRMNALLPSGTIVVADSGGHAFMLYRAIKYSEVTPMAAGSRYMSLGASLPVAIGAKLAAPERTVVSYHGDGGFYYDFADLSVLRQHGIKVIVIIDNNHCLLANRAGMKMMGFDNPWADAPETTDFVMLAKALGIDGERVIDPADIDGALQRAIAAPGSYVVDVFTDPATRMRRAMKDVIPILSDRPPVAADKNHIAPPLQAAWPTRRD